MPKIKSNKTATLVKKSKTTGGLAAEAITKLKTKQGEVVYFRLESLGKAGVKNLERLPVSIRILLENLLRNAGGALVHDEEVMRLAGWQPSNPGQREIPFIPARVVLQDYTGVPCVVDLAAMRQAVKRLGADPKKINPHVPVDLVIDHSVQVDHFGTPEAFRKNVELEFQRNRERYAFLRWAQKAFQNFSVVPPGTGIIHQVNLEYLAQVVQKRKTKDGLLAFPDTLVGTDSHTTTINGLGVLGWGVGGIEAEACMLGQPLYMMPPEVIGFKLKGNLPEGATATDLVLIVTQMLRKKGVVDKFVEFFGPGLESLCLADRATVANMAPEYGATMGFFPVDAETIRFLKDTGREESADLVERYFKEQGLWRDASSAEPCFTDTLELELASVESSMAGPRRPHDRVPLKAVKGNFSESFKSYFPADSAPSDYRKVPVKISGREENLSDGSVVIAAITSCTNTANPSAMVAAGLVAKKAAGKGLMVKSYVKTSLAPGSRVVTDYLKNSGLLEYLEKLNFHLVGYGCTTCIGNSGPLPKEVAAAVKENNLVVAAVLSGNRNFEGRVNPLVKPSYLASPPLVVAYALAGTLDIDLAKEPLGKGSDGRPVYLKDIWPTYQEISGLVLRYCDAKTYKTRYSEVFHGDDQWRSIPVPEGDLYHWEPASTYIQEPPFFKEFGPQAEPLKDIIAARALAVFGDSITTDHISPAGSFTAESPAGKYLVERGVEAKNFNSFGARRGNHEVMMRGTFGNVRLKNLLVAGTEGFWTRHLPTGEKMTIYDAAMRYGQEGAPLIVLAGKEYGSGSSRDWAAKGPMLLGIKAAITESFERIHRSNLVGMGILPLQFKEGQNIKSLGLTGEETFTIRGISQGLKPRQEMTVEVTRKDGTSFNFQAIARLASAVEAGYFANGGILPAVLRQMSGKGTQARGRSPLFNLIRNIIH
ncbi:MAG: aconitate hydratase AcnA [Elusimicrobia bacterium]|nr:aconitate hydratase AcnA [Elusimicrobiota bacterium]